MEKLDFQGKLKYRYRRTRERKEDKRKVIHNFIHIGWTVLRVEKSCVNVVEKQNRDV